MKRLNSSVLLRCYKVVKNTSVMMPTWVCCSVVYLHTRFVYDQSACHMTPQLTLTFTHHAACFDNMITALFRSSHLIGSVAPFRRTFGVSVAVLEIMDEHFHYRTSGQGGSEMWYSVLKKPCFVQRRGKLHGKITCSGSTASTLLFCQQSQASGVITHGELIPATLAVDSKNTLSTW